MFNQFILKCLAAAFLIFYSNGNLNVDYMTILVFSES